MQEAKLKAESVAAAVTRAIWSGRSIRFFRHILQQRLVPFVVALPASDAFDADDVLVVVEEASCSLLNFSNLSVFKEYALPILPKPRLTSQRASSVRCVRWHTTAQGTSRGKRKQVLFTQGARTKDEKRIPVGGTSIPVGTLWRKQCCSCDLRFLGRCGAGTCGRTIPRGIPRWAGS